MREASHIVRLAVLFVAGILLFLLVRQQLVPDGFGKYGHFRAGALSEARALPISYAGAGACAGCHEDQVEALRAGKHREVSCEACHGPHAKHAEDPGAHLPNRAEGEILCIRCHETSAAKPRWFPQVTSKEHSGGEKCGACHQAHKPK